MRNTTLVESNSGRAHQTFAVQHSSQRHPKGHPTSMNNNETNTDFSDLSALFFNCTFKPSPELSHTEGLINNSRTIMEAQSVSA